MSSIQADFEAAPKWRSASYCNNGDCVEVAILSPNKIGVRDNKDPESPILTFSGDEWAAFVSSVRQAG
jgi:hypothetical protein